MRNNNNPLYFKMGFYLRPSVAIVIAALYSPALLAQEQPPTSNNSTEAVTGDAPATLKKAGKKNQRLEETVVIGAKTNIISAQAIKRESDTLVDAISAEDIGVLPDYSVLDSMQRIPGIAMERFAASNDPDHFSAQSSGVTVRGMKQSRSEFNGRDTFTANQGRALSYQDVPPELMGSIEVYKNQTADMIEGGLGGTVSLNTRKPFDSDERILSFSTNVSYGDLAQQYGPTFSGLYSDTFATRKGEFGLLINYVKSELYSESHGVQSATYLETLAKNLLPRDPANAQFDPGAEGQRVADFIADDEQGTVWVPSSANAIIKSDEHQRTGMTAVLQYKNPDNSFNATLEYISSDSQLTWVEKAIKYSGGFFRLGSRQTRALDGTYLTLDDDGLFLAGTLTTDITGFRTGRSGNSRVPSHLVMPQWGPSHIMDSRVNDLSSRVQDTSFKAEWKPSEKFKLIGDIQYVTAKTANDDVSVHISTWLNTQFDARGDLPSVHYLDPWLGIRDATRADDAQVGGLDNNIWDAVDENGNPSFPGFGGDPAGDRNYFQDLNSSVWQSSMDHYERSEGESIALRLDGEYEFDGANNKTIKKVSAGIRFAERQQVVRSTGWNWGAIAPSWQGSNTGDWTQKTPDEIAAEITAEEIKRGEPLTDWEKKFVGLLGQGIGWLSDIEPQQDGLELVDWSNFMGGGVVHIPDDQTIHASEALIRSVSGVNPERYLRQSRVSPDNWQPLTAREGLDAKYGMFTPDEINTTTETRQALFARLDFGGNNHINYSGNIGLRYVTMERRAQGEVVFPQLDPGGQGETYPLPDNLNLPLTPESVDAYFNQQVANGEHQNYYQATEALNNYWVRNPYYYLPDDQRNFGSIKNKTTGKYEQVIRPVDTKTRYNIWLPSFNIKVDLTPDLVGRFAFAKAVAFPDMGDVRNRTVFENPKSWEFISTHRTVESEGNNIKLLESVSLPEDANGAAWVGEGGNPFMEPMESLQYDFSLEWYFSDAGQLSAAIFHKNLSNYFAPGIIYREFTQPESQATQTAAITSKRNGGDAKLDGLELTYQHFFGGMFEGFGVQSAFTYVDANSVPNNVQRIENESWYLSLYEDTGIRVNYDKLPLEGQSDKIVNITGMYENETWSANLSYNWRSEYLLTTRDVTTKAPIWLDALGELNGSIFYSINNHFTVGVQAKNITNEVAKTRMVLNDELLTAGRSWFVADRRIALVLKGQF